MLRTVLTGSLVAGALLAGGGAHAQGYGDNGYGYGGPGVSVGAGVGLGYGGGYVSPYAPYRPRGFTLAGVRAGVTVLGVDLDGSAKLTIGVHGGGYRPAPAYPAPSYPAPSYPEATYPAPPPPGYWMGYSSPAPYVMSYGCGCAPPPPSCCAY